MWSRSSLVVAAASAAAQSGPAAVLLCDSVVREIEHNRTEETLSERQILLARSEKALRQQKSAAKKGWTWPQLNWNRLLSITSKRPRVAA